MSRNNEKKLLIAIPAFNEEKNLIKIIKSLNNYKNVLIINDGSTDKTKKILKKIKVTSISHRKNLGYEKTIETGMKYFLKKKFKKLIFIDADGDHPKKYIKIFSKALNNFDLVCGIRKKVPRFGEKFFLFFSKIIWNLNDPLCGMKGYNYRFLKINFEEDKFNSIQTKFLIKAKKNRYKIKEIPILNKPRLINSKFGNGIITNFYIISVFFRSLFRH